MTKDQQIAMLRAKLDGLSRAPMAKAQEDAVRYWDTRSKASEAYV